MPIAVIAFDFDPLVQLTATVVVRWQTLALALAVLVSLATAAVLARRQGLRADDLLYMAIGAAPGAIVGGRIGYALLVPEAFSGGPLTLVDPSIGGLELGLAVVGGIATGSVVGALLGAPVLRWAHVVTIPLLTAIVAGKLAMVLGGAGQGRSFEGDWATAFLGAGPWVSAAAGVPSHPSQVYEALGTTVAALLVLIASSLGAFRSREASRLLVAIALWCLVRATVATTWRDPVVLGPLPMGGVIALLVAAGALVGAIVEGAWRPRRSRAARAAAQPAWPDPETRPPF